MAGQRIAAFAWQMLGQSSKPNADASGSFLSPVSLYIALGLALNGAGKFLDDSCASKRLQAAVEYPCTAAAAAAAMPMHAHSRFAICSLDFVTQHPPITVKLALSVCF
jgi:serine protease inhibitor